MTSRRNALAGVLALLVTRARPGVKHALGSDRLIRPLQWLPALPGGNARWPTWILTFADIAGYFSGTGIEHPRSFDDETTETWRALGERIPIDDKLLFLFPREAWRDLVGFSPWDVDQLAMAFDPPAIRIYKGKFDLDLIKHRLAEENYVNRSVGGFVILDSLSEEIHIESKLDKYSMGGFKHVAASEQMVVAARHAEGRDQTLEVLEGLADSFANAPELAAVADAATDMTGFLLFNGRTLSREFIRDAPRSGGDIPPARLLLGGIHIGEVPGVSLIVDLEEPEAAAAAAAVIESRIGREVSVVSGQPYAELLAGYHVDAVPQTGLVRVTVPDEEFARRWMRMFYTLDLNYLATA